MKNGYKTRASFDIGNEKIYVKNNNHQCTFSSEKLKIIELKSRIKRKAEESSSLLRELFTVNVIIPLLQIK